MTTESAINASDIEQQFKISGVLTVRKMLRYFVSLLLTNFSTLLLISVDGLVAGLLVGSDALASVSIFYPVVVIVGLLTDLTAHGAATRLSVKMGEIDQKGLLRTKDAVFKLTVLFALITALIQYPLAKIIVDSYHLSDDLRGSVTAYASGVMFSMPFGLISSVGMLVLQDFGKMDVLIFLSGVESITNLLLDVLFVGAFKMGIAGAGYGTAIANIVRASLTVWYVAKYTDFFYFGGEKASLREMIDTVAAGMPELSSSGISALQQYFMIMIIINVFPENGGVIKGICSFTANLSGVLTRSVISAMRPMCGLLIGAQAWKPLHMLMKQGFAVIIAMTAGFIMFVELFPHVIFSLHGVSDIPAGGILSLRFFCLYIVFNGISAALRMYLSVRNYTKFATFTTVAGYITLPVFAYVLSTSFPAPYVWFAYLLTEIVVMLPSLFKYMQTEKIDMKNDEHGDKKIYMSVSPDTA